MKHLNSWCEKNNIAIKYSNSRDVYLRNTKSLKPIFTKLFYEEL